MTALLNPPHRRAVARASEQMNWSRFAFTKLEAKRIVSMAKRCGITAVTFRRNKVSGVPRYRVVGSAKMSDFASFVSEEARRDMRPKQPSNVANGGAASEHGGSKGPSVGRRRTRKPPRKGLSEFERAWAEHLGGLIGDNAGSVAEALGVSHDAVLKWCAGDSFPSPNRYTKLAAALNLRTVKDLFPAGY